MKMAIVDEDVCCPSLLPHSVNHSSESGTELLGSLREFHHRVEIPGLPVRRARPCFSKSPNHGEVGGEYFGQGQLLRQGGHSRPGIQNVRDSVGLEAIEIAAVQVLAVTNFYGITKGAGSAARKGSRAATNSLVDALRDPNSKIKTAIREAWGASGSRNIVCSSAALR